MQCVGGVYTGPINIHHEGARTLIPHMFGRLRTALASLFALLEPTAEPLTDDVNPYDDWRYHAGFYCTWYW
jgi:hypothetical protein